MTYHWHLEGRRALVLGSRGLVGSALVRRLTPEPCELIAATREDADLMDAKATHDYIAQVRPDAVFIAAAKVGGILANSDAPVDFLEDNLIIQLNVLRACHAADVERVVLLGSSCIYPKFADQPISEDSLMTGPLEATNDAYAIAKIAGIRLVDAYREQHGRDWISAMPTNLYGPGDNFDLRTSHVLPALIRKFHEARTGGRTSVTVWGTGTPRREFMHADDCADALIHLLRHYNEPGPINVGVGEDISIRELSEHVATIIGYEGRMELDTSKPDGTPRKLMDSRRLQKLGWSPSIALEDGIAQTYAWYRNAGEPG